MGWPSAAAIQMTATEIRVADDWATILGTATAGNGALESKFMMVVERRDGGWRIARLIWNDDAEG